MRETGFILLVLLVILALTAIKYRKQIAGAIGVARALRQAREEIARSHQQPRVQTATQLVNCSKCCVWVPQDKAQRRGEVYLCADCR